MNKTKEYNNIISKSLDTNLYRNSLMNKDPNLVEMDIGDYIKNSLQKNIQKDILEKTNNMSNKYSVPNF